MVEFEALSALTTNASAFITLPDKQAHAIRTAFSSSIRQTFEVLKRLDFALDLF